jgi:regulation of enolase protein 1 (concanavalin A-like superfamily)
MFIGDNLNSHWIKSDERSSDIEYTNIPDGLSMITSHDRNDLNSNRIKNYLSKFHYQKSQTQPKMNGMIGKIT